MYMLYVVCGYWSGSTFVRYGMFEPFNDYDAPCISELSRSDSFWIIPGTVNPMEG